MMKKGILAIIRYIVFFILLVVLIIFLNETFMAKYMYDQSEPHTETYDGFYQMERNSIDVLILGTSHGASGFNPQDFYDAAHVRAYNLSSSAQPVWASYYWLKEALNYQKPSAVIFECNYLFSDYTNEGANRKTLDNMRIGKVKYEATKTAVAINEEVKESTLSYFFPYIRYHSRWKNLNERDFTWGTIEKPSVMKGFWFYSHIAHYEGFTPLANDGRNTDRADFVQMSFEYFEKIVELCQVEGIQLILTKTPFHTFSIENHNAIQAYAVQKDLPFYDFNMDDLYTKIGFNYYLDINDAGKNNAHANTSGARKMSRFMSQEIVAHRWAEPCVDIQWESTKKFNEDLYKDFLLANTTNINNYLRALNDERYTIFISVRDEATTSMTDEIRTDLANLGLKETWAKALRHSYLAMIDRGNVIYEKLSDKAITYKDSFQNGRMRIDMLSAGYNAGNKSSIKIDNVENSKNLRGLNIVVYNNERRCVIDSVNFDTWDPELPCKR